MISMFALQRFIGIFNRRIQNANSVAANFTSKDATMKDFLL